MSDSKKNPKMPPPDDFAKTSPNVDFDDEGLAEWEKTQVNKPSDAPSDDWGKTVINYNTADEDESETQENPQYNTNVDPKEPDWGVTRANINLDDDDFRGDNDFEIESDGATVPYFRLPEAERAKYQKIAPTPTEKARKEEEEKKKAGGIPTWFWVTAGLMTMFSFAALVLLVVVFLLSGTSGFTVIVKGAQPSSQVFVDGARWGTTSPDGSLPLRALRAGERKIIVRRKGYKDFEQPVKGGNGDEIPIIVQQVPAERECVKIDVTNVDEREKCANTILDNLDTPPNLKDLLRALNLYYINFDSGKHNIPSERMRFLERASTYIKQLPSSVVIEIGGHTDSDGDDEDNMALSERRAESVKKAFIGFGANEAMLVTKGYGETDPKDTNETESGKFQNRRIAYKPLKR